MELRGFLSCCEQLPVEWTCSLPHVHYLKEGSVPFLFFRTEMTFLRQWMEVVSVFGDCGKQSKRVYLTQSDFDAHGLTQGCAGCRAMREGIRAQGHSAVCRARLQGTAKGQERLQEAERRTRDTAGERAAKRIKLHGRRNSPREKEDDKERAKRQRTEKKTQQEMEVSNVAKVNDRRRILDMRRDGWEPANVNQLVAAMFCASELRPRVMLTTCTERTQLESTWALCRAQGAQGLGFVCEFVGNIADDPVAKNIQNSRGCNDTIIRECLSGPSISVISNYDYIRCRVQRAMKETGLLNSQDTDGVVEDSVDEDGEELVADDAKKGSMPIRLVNQAKTEEQKYFEKDKGIRGSRSKRGKWKQSDQDQMGRHQQRNARETKRSGSVGCTGVPMGGRSRL